MVIEDRIRGIEQEYPISGNFDPSFLVNTTLYKLTELGYSRRLKWCRAGEADPHPKNSTHGINGSRIYNDLNHLEISSPSYANPLDAVAYEKTGEILAYLGSKETGRALKETVYTYKNNISTVFVGQDRFRSKTYATHGNINLSREACKDWKRVEEQLLPWMITRILFTGSGGIVSGRLAGFEEPKFVISPRAMFTYSKSSLDTTIKRGILNTRDEPHANPKRYFRFHDIHYEGLRCEYSIFLRDLTQTMVIQAFEDGLLTGAPKIREPVKTFKELSKDTTECKWTVELEGKKKTDAPQILNFYLGRIEKMYEDREMNQLDKVGLKSFKKILSRLVERRLSRLVDGVDWITKLAFLVNYEAESARKAIHICNQYSLIGRSVLGYINKKHHSDHSLFNPKESISFAKKEVPEMSWDKLRERIHYSIENGTKETRDHFRSHLLKKFPDEIKEINWSRVKLRDGEVKLDEPFMLSQGEFEVGEEDPQNVLRRIEKLYPSKVK